MFLINLNRKDYIIYRYRYSCRRTHVYIRMEINMIFVYKHREHNLCIYMKPDDDDDDDDTKINYEKPTKTMYSREKRFCLISNFIFVF